MNPSFIAEVSSNHHQDIERCYQFIDTASAIGCSAVKFQLFRINELFAPEILAKSEVHRKRQDWELPVAFLPLLAERCRVKKIQFSCTPFYLEAVQELQPYVDFYKIASYELLWDDLLVACAKTGKPVIISTGMATMEEIAHAVEVLRAAGCQRPSLLHCVSGYPVPAQECNLAAIQTLREQFNCSVGWSDHSVDPTVIARAVHRWGAETVEFHLDLEGEGAEFAAGHCWLPEPVASIIAACQNVEVSDGEGVKQPSPSELDDRLWRADPCDGLRPFLEIREAWRD